jgi:heme/copper-type cytochrome/quinol oxidase subunit 3
MPRSLSDGNWPLSSRQQASGYPAEISMNSLTSLLFGLIFVVLVVGVFFELLFLTFFIYAVSHLYPWLRKIGVWAARPENLQPLILLAVLLIILASVLLHATLLLLLIVFPILLFSSYRSGYTGIGDQVYRMDL